MAAPMGPLLFVLALICIWTLSCHGIRGDEGGDEKWKKKDIRDYTDADLERLYEQWEDNDEDELEADELPEWKKTPKKIDLSNVDMKDPEAILKASKKGKTVMMFVTISGKPGMADTETISSIWHTGLINGNLDARRFVTDPGRVMFVVDDGAYAWPIKDFLVMQDNCEEVTIDGKSYPGKGAKSAEEEKKDEL